jgi:hypothetical protein
LVGKPEGKRPLGRPRRRWEDNIIMDLQEAEHVACRNMGERRGAYRYWRGNLKERYHLKDQDVDKRIILQWIYKKWNM